MHVAFALFQDRKALADSFLGQGVDWLVQKPTMLIDLSLKFNALFAHGLTVSEKAGA
jgi:hypothetical protein